MLIRNFLFTLFEYDWCNKANTKNMPHLRTTISELARNAAINLGMESGCGGKLCGKAISSFFITLSVTAVQ